MKSKWLKQFGVSFLIVLSLFVSSVSACACSHHQEKSEAENAACHHDSVMAGMEMAHENAGQSDALVSNAECSCVQPAAKVFAKNNSLKFEKQQAIIPSVVRFEIKSVAAIVEFKKITFAPPFYLSDSFHNLSPGRAPPRL